MISALRTSATSRASRPASGRPCSKRVPHNSLQVRKCSEARSELAPSLAKHALTQNPLRPKAEALVVPPDASALQGGFAAASTTITGVSRREASLVRKCSEARTELAPFNLRTPTPDGAIPPKTRKAARDQAFGLPRRLFPIFQVSIHDFQPPQRTTRNQKGFSIRLWLQVASAGN